MFRPRPLPKSWKPSTRRCSASWNACGTSRRARFRLAIQSEIEFALILSTERMTIECCAPHTIDSTMRSGSGAFAELDRHIHFFAAAIKRHGDAVAGPLVIEGEVDVELACDFLVVDCHDDVATDVDPAHRSCRHAIAAANSGVRGRPALGGSLHKQAVFDVQ